MMFIPSFMTIGKLMSIILISITEQSMDRHTKLTSRILKKEL